MLRLVAISFAGSVSGGQLPAHGENIVRENSSGSGYQPCPVDVCRKKPHFADAKAAGSSSYMDFWSELLFSFELAG
jgi:hypothetical protein